jgi:uncharacterized membrane protein YgaE (UPF0421/DUF939 family)
MVRRFLLQFARLMLVPVGALVAIISSFGVLAIFSEWGEDAGSIFWDIFWLIFWLVLALIGAGLAFFGLGVRLPSKKKPNVA